MANSNTVICMLQFFVLNMFFVVNAAERSYVQPETPTRAEVRKMFNEELEEQACTAFANLLEDNNPEMNQTVLIDFACARIFGVKPKCLKQREQMIRAIRSSNRSKKKRKAYMNKQNILFTFSCAELAQLCDRKKLKEILTPTFRFWVLNEFAQWPDSLCVPFPEPELPSHWQGEKWSHANIDLFQQRPASIVLDFLMSEQPEDSVGLNWRRPVLNEIEQFVLPSHLVAHINTPKKYDRYKSWVQDKRLAHDPILFYPSKHNVIEWDFALMRWQETRNRAMYEMVTKECDDAESDYTRQERCGPNSGAIVSYINGTGNCYVEHTYPNLLTKQRALCALLLSSSWRKLRQHVHDEAAREEVTNLFVRT